MFSTIRRKGGSGFRTALKAMIGVVDKVGDLAVGIHLRQGG
jgi:hypothetical protein